MPTDDPREPEDPTRVFPQVPDLDATQVMPVVPRESHDMPPSVAPPPLANSAATPLPSRNRASTVAIWLAIILMVLLIISILGAFLTRGGPFAPAVSASPVPSFTQSVAPSPSPSLTPSPSPSPTPTETTPPPPPERLAFTSFDAPREVECPDDSSTAEVTITWSSTGASQAWIGIETKNAKEEPYSEVSTSGSATVPFPCSNRAQEYTVTLDDGDGNLEHRSANVKRHEDKGPGD